MTHRALLELEARELVNRIAPELRRLRPAGKGFALVLFDHEAQGSVAYLSDSRRSDLVRTAASLVMEAAGGGLRSAFDEERRS